MITWSFVSLYSGDIIPALLSPTPVLAICSHSLVYPVGSKVMCPLVMCFQICYTGFVELLKTNVQTLANCLLFKIAWQKCLLLQREMLSLALPWNQPLVWSLWTGQGTLYHTFRLCALNSSVPLPPPPLLPFSPSLRRWIRPWLNNINIIFMGLDL